MLLLLYTVVSARVYYSNVDGPESAEAPAEVSARSGGVCLLAAEERSGEKSNVKQMQRQETQYKESQNRPRSRERRGSACGGFLTASGEAKPRRRVRPSPRFN